MNILMKKRVMPAQLGGITEAHPDTASAAMDTMAGTFTTRPTVNNHTQRNGRNVRATEVGRANEGAPRIMGLSAAVLVTSSDCGAARISRGAA